MLYCLSNQQTQGGAIMAVTAQKIAELAGVSRGTVDRALHNRGRVNPEVAARIRKIADELGYKPNIVGQALVRSKRGARIGVILQSIETPTMQLDQWLGNSYPEADRSSLPAGSCLPHN